MIVSCLGPILGILLIDLVLSGDNAVVIGAAASGLPRQQRMIALIVGGGGAVVLRIILALAATLLLQLRFIGIIGGIILFCIALRLLTERSAEQRVDHSEWFPIAKPRPNENKPHTESPHSQLAQPVQKRRPHKSLLTSMITILLADVTMSLDNILAIGGLAGGNVVPLIIGLVFSVIFLLVGSALVAASISHLPWLLDLACLIVAWTAAQIFLGDDSLNDFFIRFPWVSSSIPVITSIIVLITDISLRIRDHQINYPNKL